MLFVLRLRVAVFIALCLSAATGSFMGNTLKNVDYFPLKETFIQAGYTEFHADCLIQALKVTGTAEDIAEILSDPNAIVENLHQKANFADFICSLSGLIATLLFLGLALLTCYFCCINCFVSSCKGANCRLLARCHLRLWRKPVPESLSFEWCYFSGSWSDLNFFKFSFDFYRP